MPQLSVWMIRAAFGYFGLGFTFGALMLFNKGIPIAPWLWRLLPVHIEFLLLGWSLQLAMGVAFWIMPRIGGRRGDVRLAWAAFVLINVGVLTVGVTSWFGSQPGVLLAGRIVEFAAAVAYVAHMWPRIRTMQA